MAEQRTKSLTYHRAEHIGTNSHGFDLENCINQAIMKLPTVPDRSIQRDGGSVMRLIHHERPGTHRGCFLHLTSETTGEHASIVPSPEAGARDLQTSTFPPPNSAEFMDGDAFLYVVGNDACLCATAVRIRAIQHFLQKLFEKANLNLNCTKFIFLNAADTVKLAQILMQHGGIKEIQLKASLFHASAEYIRRRTQEAGLIGRVATSLMGGVATSIKAIFGHDDVAVDDALRVGLTLRVDRRSKSKIGLGQEKLEKLAENIIQFEEEGDDYVIILESGEKIKPSEIVLTKPVDLEREGKTVTRESAFRALRSYYKELADTKKLEQ